MTEEQLREALGRFPIACLCNAHEDVMAVGSAITPIWVGARMVGPARTASILPGQNAAIHRAVHLAHPGEVLVVAGGGNRSYGPFGDILAEACRRKGIVGAVLDCTTRDSADIAKMEFPVFSLGSNPMGTAKSAPGEIDVQVTCGDASICPGDFVAADADGVVVIPRAILQDIVPLAMAVLDREDQIRLSLELGKTSCEILNIPF